MNSYEIVEKARTEFTQLSKIQVDSVIALSQKEDCWLVTVEGLERSAIPDTMDLLGRYEIRLDNDGNLLGFERKKLRKRGDTEE
jgi:hypothetical protein